LGGGELLQASRQTRSKNLKKKKKQLSTIGGNAKKREKEVRD